MKLWLRIFKDETKRERVLRSYIHWQKIYIQGSTQMNFWRGMVADMQGYALYWMLGKQYFPKLSLTAFILFLPVVVLLRIALNIGIGLWWDKEQMFQRENDWGNIRNPVQMKINEKLLGGEGITKGEDKT